MEREGDVRGVVFFARSVPHLRTGGRRSAIESGLRAHEQWRTELAAAPMAVPAAPIAARSRAAPIAARSMAAPIAAAQASIVCWSIVIDDFVIDDFGAFKTTVVLFAGGANRGTARQRDGDTSTLMYRDVSCIVYITDTSRYS